MPRLLLLLIPLLLFIIALFSQKKSTQNSVPITQEEQHHFHHPKKIDPNCTRCVEKYIEEVINKGSNIFHYPTSPMPGGTVSKEEAKKIAAFMVKMQGYKPSHPEWVQEGKYLFYGNCTGCHSNGGRGKKGYFPDLSQKPLQGITILNKGS